jgi:hypothetical protein
MIAYKWGITGIMREKNKEKTGKKQKRKEHQRLA